MQTITTKILFSFTIFLTIAISIMLSQIPFYLLEAGVITDVSVADALGVVGFVVTTLLHVMWISYIINRPDGFKSWLIIFFAIPFFFFFFPVAAYLSWPISRLTKAIISVFANTSNERFLDGGDAALMMLIPAGSMIVAAMIAPLVVFIKERAILSKAKRWLTKTKKI